MTTKVYDKEHPNFYHLEPTYHVRRGSEDWSVTQNNGEREQAVAYFHTREDARYYKSVLEDERRET